MENDWQTLIQSLSDAVSILDGIYSGDSEADDTSSEAPHIELIDFDKLHNTLADAVAAVRASERLDRDAAVARNWLTNRIVSLKRGRNAVLSSQSTNNDISPLDQSTLSGLINQYEEAAAGLRRLVPADQQRRATTGRDNYQEFKS